MTKNNNINRLPSSNPNNFNNNNFNPFDSSMDGFPNFSDSLSMPAGITKKDDLTYEVKVPEEITKEEIEVKESEGQLTVKYKRKQENKNETETIRERERRREEGNYSTTIGQSLKIKDIIKEGDTLTIKLEKK